MWTHYNLFANRKKSYKLLICRVAKNLRALELLNHFIKSSTAAYKRVAFKTSSVFALFFTDSNSDSSLFGLFLLVPAEETNTKKRNEPAASFFFPFSILVTFFVDPLPSFRAMNFLIYAESKLHVFALRTLWKELVLEESFYCYLSSFIISHRLLF